MPGKFVLPVFFAVLLLGAIVLGPLIYFGVGLVWHVPFHRAMNRGLMISAVATMALFAPRIEWRKLWPWNVSAGRQALLGVFIAAVTIQALLGFDAALAGFSSSHLEAGKAVARVLLAVVAAVLVAPLEETIFRGFLQRELARVLGWRVGWIGAAAVYMMAHFLKTPAQYDQEVHPWSGFAALIGAFGEVGASLNSEPVKAVNLFILGLTLGGMYLRAETLWANAGLHAGLILGLVIFTGFTRPDEPPHVPYFGGDILSSPVTTMVLILLGLWIWRFYRHPSVVPEIGATAP